MQLNLFVCTFADSYIFMYSIVKWSVNALRQYEN